MKILTTLRLPVAALCILGGAQGALAHETHTYRIGTKTYQMTVGSLNEPVVVDDKTGFDFRVSIPAVGKGDPTPVAGLDQMLKVEVAAGGKKKVFDLQPSAGTPGTYKTTFYPTVQTTLSYRVFGTIDSVPLDVSFTCNPAGHPRTPDDTNEVKISDQVTQLSRRGAFGCPVAKAAMGFPEAAPSAIELQTRVSDLNTALADAHSQASRGFMFGLAGLLVGAIGAIAGVGAWVGRKQQLQAVPDRRSTARAKT